MSLDASSPDTGAIWASLPIPALLVTAEDRIHAINPAAESFLRASNRGLSGQPVLDVLAIDAQMDTGFALVRRSQAPLIINEVAVTTGERAPVQCTLQLAPVQDHPELLLLLISPGELAERLGRSGGAKSAARSAIGMAEMLAHEIKNPLAGISGAAQLLSMGLPPEDQELTDLIVEETRRVVKLLDQVEQFGNTRPPEKAEVNLHDVLDRARRSAQVGFGARMRILEDYDPSLPPAWADADQLQQVFLNLLKNASEAAGPEGGTLRLRSYYDHTLRLRQADGTGDALPLTIEIIDDGPGIPPEIGLEVFEPFVSGRPNGTGLGLALVSKIISDHGGWISVESVPGRTAFRISLPRVPKAKRTS